MKRDRIIEFVGGSEEDIAYLRLSLRKAAQQLADKWRLRREEDSHVDLLVIEDLGEAGAVGTPATADASPRRVRLIDPAFGAAGMETVAWPLTLETLIRLLNLTGFVTDMSPPAAGLAIQQNVYDDLFESELSDRWRTTDNLITDVSTADFDEPWRAPPRAQESELTWQAEQLFRNDPRELHKHELKAIRLDDDLDFEATAGMTVRGALHRDRRGGSGVLSDPKLTLAGDEANAAHAMATYLTGRLLSGPSRIEAFDIAMVLDPRNRQYYAKGGLCIFEECCKRPLRRGDWRGLTANEFAEVKKQIVGRPYAELHWLCAYLDSSTATDDFGADARYRLIQGFELQRDYPRAARVARALELGSTLTAAAAFARVPLAEAQRVAAAFDAVGSLIPD